MALLDMRTREVKRLLNHPAVRGLPIIGRGRHTIAFDKGETVVKMTVDWIQRNFYQEVDNHAFPKIHKDWGEVGECKELPVYLLESEKLKPISVKTPGWSFISRLIKDYVNNYPSLGRATCSECSAVSLLKLAENPSLGTNFKTALYDIADYVIRNDCVADFHEENFMQRGDQIVINDPVACVFGHQLYNNP